MDLNRLMRTIEYTFHDEALLLTALTHPSFGVPDNQRLEFLGDAVLELCVSDLLFAKYRTDQEGRLTRRRAQLVCESTLYKAALGIGLPEHIRMDHACEQSGGRERKSIVSDAMEALIAAVYLDGGIEKARSLIGKIWRPLLNVKNSDQDAKSVLQEFLQAKGLSVPAYRLISRSGPDHQPSFCMALLIDGREVARAVGGSKQQAEQNAARIAMSELCGGEKNEAEEA